MRASVLNALGLALLLQAGPAPAAEPTPAEATPAAVTASMPVRADASGRLQAQVTLDGRGPFSFTVDTAATGIVLSQALAARLGVRTGAGRRVVGGIGQADSQTANVNELGTDAFVLRNVSMALLPGLSGDGILGMAPFIHSRIELDLAAHRLSIGPSAPTPDGFAALDGQLNHGILVVDVRIDGVAAKALVDTGAPYNIGNPKLQAALGLPPGDARLSPGGTFADGFGQQRMVEQATAGRIGVGAVTFSQPVVRFADMPVFRALGLDDGPAMILGIGQLAQMRAIAIDFPHAQLQLRP